MTAILKSIVLSLFVEKFSHLPVKVTGRADSSPYQHYPSADCPLLPGGQLTIAVFICIYPTPVRSERSRVSGGVEEPALEAAFDFAPPSRS
ncbi:MAG: hypothetical protein ACRERD_27585 [Candidatus Binatia bacterium]